MRGYRQFADRRFQKPQMQPSLKSTSLLQGLVLGALLNEGGGQLPVYNVLGRNHGAMTGTVTGGTPVWSSSKFGKGFFNQSPGSSGAIDFGPLSNYPSLSNAFSIFIMPGFTSANNQRALMISSPASSSNHLGITIANAGTQWLGYFLNGVGTEFDSFITPTRSDNRYPDTLVFTFDGSSWKGYQNGILKTTAATTGTYNGQSTEHIYLSGWTGPNNQNLIGLITAFGIWNRALTYPEIQALYMDPHWAFAASRKLFSSPTALSAVTMRRTFTQFGTGVGKRQLQWR